MQRYENFVGLTEVKAAQARVVQSERRFIGKYLGPIIKYFSFTVFFC
jgi:hypothetical protein